MPQDSKQNRSKNQDQLDTDTGQSLGSFLQRERLKKQFTLEEVAEKTCIHIATLKAIESNDRNKMPAEVFVRGFIKLYADFLSLDKQEILERYDRERGNIEEDKAHSDNVLSSEKLAESTSFFSVSKFLVLCILLGLVGLGYYFYLSSQEPAQAPTSFPLKSETVSTEEPNEEISLEEITTNPVPYEDEIDAMLPIEEVFLEEPSVPEDDLFPIPPSPPDEINSPSIEENGVIPTNESTLQNQDTDKNTKEATVATVLDEIDEAVEATPSSVTIDQEQPAPEVEEKKINLRILFTERTWIQISIDNNPPEDFLFDPEEESSWQATDKMKLFLGNSGGVVLFVDDREVPIPGVSGSPLRITIPDDLPKYGMEF